MNIYNFFPLFFFLFLFTFIYLFIFYYLILLYNYLTIKIIEIDISQADKDGGGPIQFIKSIKKILPYKNKGCLFIPSKSIRPINSKNKSDYFYISLPYFPESIYNEWILSKRSNSLIIGPNFIPSK